MLAGRLPAESTIRDLSTLLLYGSYGFVSDPIAREAIDRGLDPILAGRDQLREQGDEEERSVVVDQFEHYGFETLLGETNADIDVGERSPRER